MTTAKPAAPATRNADAELEALSAAINDVILVLDAEGRYVKIAPTNPSLLYRPAGELLGKTLREVFDGAQADQFMEYIRTALETRTTVHFEYRLSIGGRELWFSGAISPMSGDQVVLVGRDIKIAPTNPSLLYRPAGELLGKTLREVFDGAQADQFMEYIRTALETRTTVHFEYRLSIGGRELWFSGAISPMSGDQVVLVGRDI